MNTPWSSTEGSCDTVSVALSEMTNPSVLAAAAQSDSAERLVNRKALLERMGLNTENGGQSNKDTNAHHNGTDNNGDSEVNRRTTTAVRSTNSMDRLSMGSQVCHAPKVGVKLNGTTSIFPSMHNRAPPIIQSFPSPRSFHGSNNRMSPPPVYQDHQADAAVVPAG